MLRFNHHFALFSSFPFRRTGYLTAESKIMTNAQDEVSSMPESERRTASPFALALERSQLARDLKKVFEDMGNTGKEKSLKRKYRSSTFLQL
jgi:hypothetical protein